MSDYVTDFVVFREATDWAEVRKDHLRPEIRNVEDYNRALREGVERASRFLRDCKPVPSTSELQEAHRLMFNQIYTDAGRLREEGDHKHVEGREGSPGRLVAKDLSALERNSTEAHSQNGVEERIEAACVHLASLEKIRPFESGNGEVSRLVLAHQLEKHFGGKLEFGRPINDVDRQMYAEARDQAYALGEQWASLRPLKSFATDFSRQSLQVEAERVDKKMQQAVAELEQRRQQESHR